MNNNFLFREETAALRRPAYLGMLYDRRRNKLLSGGKTLWSPEELKANVHIQSNPSTKTEILKNESISEKTHALNVDGLLKLDVLCNNVDVHGAASYLKEEKGSKRQARVALKYEANTQFECLTMEHLKDTMISNAEVLDEGIATHVVVGIQYGGTVVTKFVKEVTEEKSSKTVQGEMKAAVEKLKRIVSCGGKVEVNRATQSTFTFTFTLVKVGKILEGYRANYKLKILTKYTKTIIKSFN